MIGAAGQSFTFVDSQMTLAAAALGQSGEVRETERKLFATREKRYVPAYDLAMVRLALADHAGALRLLRETVDERSAWAIYMAVDSRLIAAALARAGVRGNPEARRAQ